MLDTTPGTSTINLVPPWEGLVAAWLAQVHARSGGTRTTAEYRRYAHRFLESCPDLRRATPARVHAFAYAPMLAAANQRFPDPRR